MEDLGGSDLPNQSFNRRKGCQNKLLRGSYEVLDQFNAILHKEHFNMISNDNKKLHVHLLLNWPLQIAIVIKEVTIATEHFLLSVAYYIGKIFILKTAQPITKINQLGMCISIIE